MLLLPVWDVGVVPDSIVSWGAGPQQQRTVPQHPPAPELAEVLVASPEVGTSVPRIFPGAALPGAGVFVWFGSCFMVSSIRGQRDQTDALRGVSLSAPT